MNFLKSAIAFSVVAACSFSAANATSITVTTAGSLANAGIDEQETELAIVGQINAEDFFYIGQKLSNLTSLDLSNATIVAYDGDRLTSGASSYKANVIPAISLSMLPLKSVVFPTEGSIVIGECAFAGTALTELNLPSNVISLGNGAFQYCTALESVTLNGQEIGTGVFAGCTALKTVSLGSTISAIPVATFSGCSALTTISSSDKITEVGERAFLNCSALASFDFSNNITAIGSRAFENTALVDVNLKNASKLKSVGDRAFLGCASLQSVSLPDNLAEVGTGTFFECPALTTITIPSALTELSDHLFKGDTALASNDLIGAQVATVGEYALKDASSVTKLVLPASLESIGDGAMEGMTGLSKIDATALEEVPAVGTDVWAGVEQSNVTLSVDKSMFSDFANAEQWKEFKIDASTESNDMVFDQGVAAVKVVGRFQGTNLIVIARGSDISAISLYTPAGQLLTTVHTSADSAVIDTSAYDTNIFIVSATLANGTIANVKLLRK